MPKRSSNHTLMNLLPHKAQLLGANSSTFRGMWYFVSYIPLLKIMRRSQPSGWLLPHSGHMSLTVGNHILFPSQEERLTGAGSLFLPTSSPERKHWGLLLLAKVIDTAPSEFLKHVFTTNTLMLLITHLKTDERYLHRSATKAVQALHKRASQDHSFVADAIQGLVLGSSGLYNFDSVTKTKTVAKLLTAADVSTFQTIVPAICAAIERPDATDEKQADAKRRGFGDIMVSACTRALAMVDEENGTPKLVAEMALDALVGIAYSKKSLGPDGRVFEPPPSPECRAYFRSRIRTCLDQSLQHGATKSTLLSYAVHRLKVLQAQTPPDHAILEFDAETQAIVEKAWKNLGKISKAVRRTCQMVPDVC